MNVIGLFRSTEYIGAKELRVHLDKILKSNHPLRVMLHNKPTVAIIPDDKYMELLEFMEDMRESGLLSKAVKRFHSKSRKKNAWFWSEEWQKGEKEVEKEIRFGKKPRRAASAKDIIDELNT
ncbi:MAG: hypothetical protein ACKVQC_01865 [Elusimicrobiota bacterium]